MVVGQGTRFAALTDAPHCSVRLYDSSDSLVAEHTLLPAADGIHSLVVEGVGHGMLYRFALGERALPDPYARFLPQGVHGPAMVIAPRYELRFDCVSRPLSEHVIYELHVGTFTPEGTYASAAERLEELAKLGVTTLELMPIAAFDGTRGWGYDGVAHYAPFAPYGTPDELRAFIDRAHELGLAVLLDVVYNHFGPSGNYLGAYDRRYFTRDQASPWGDAPNFAFLPMRRYVVENALYWLDDFRFDGLRLDATHALFDPSPTHVVAELAGAVAERRPKRLIVAEDERNDPSLVTRFGIDALWADDFHHATRVTLTGERDGYYAAYAPGAETIARTIRRGWLYEGQQNPLSGKRRGASADELSAEHFVYCIQNHDQVGNRALGDRLSQAMSLDTYLAVSILLLFLPMTPLLFMGQEWAASTPFLYFTDHEDELGRKITEGRRREFASFLAFSSEGHGLEVPDPQALDSFVRSRLDWAERTEPEHVRVLDTYERALRLRASDPVLREPSRERLRSEAVEDVLCVERFRSGARRLLFVNFSGREVPLRDLIVRFGLSAPRRLLSTRPEADAVFLGVNEAVVLAGGEP
jgi:maltooligosyltrehalose trehalohydrolase